MNSVVVNICTAFHSKYTVTLGKLIVFFSTASTAFLRNVALNKQSYQVSTLRDRFGAHGAILANDGSRQTVSFCAHSLNATNPWWAVDLEVPTLVFRVDLTSSGNAAGTNNGFALLFV